MDPNTWLMVLAPAAVLLIGFGLLGGWGAGRLGAPRLVGAVLAGMLLGPAVLGRVAPDVHRYLFVGDIAQHQQLDAKRQQMRDAIEAAQDSGVTAVYIHELRARYQKQFDELERTAIGSQTNRRNTLGAVLGIPALLTSLWITIAGLIAPPRRNFWCTNLSVMLAGTAFSAAATAGVGLWLIHMHWVDAATLSPRTYLIALGIGCMIPAIPAMGRLREVDDAPLWRWLFEPLVCALAGSQVALFAEFNGILVLAVLILFGDAKALGAMCVMRGLRRASWRQAMKIGALAASGSSLALAAATVLYCADLLTGEAITALVLANVIAAASASPLARMIDQTFADSGDSDSAS